MVRRRQVWGAANAAPLRPQVHLGRGQQDQDGRVRGARARPAARQRLLRAGVQRPRVRGAVGSVGFKLLRWARGETPGKSRRCTPAAPQCCVCALCTALPPTSTFPTCYLSSSAVNKTTVCLTSVAPACRAIVLFL